MAPLQPVLLLTVYKHLNLIEIKLVRFAAVIRNIQQGRHLYYNFGPPVRERFFFFVTQKVNKIKRSFTQEVHQHLTNLTSLHFSQNFPCSVSKTLQSWCRALKVFYQISLLPLCDAFCHVYERNLKLLKIGNISSVSKHELKSSDRLFRFHLQMNVQ